MVCSCAALVLFCYSFDHKSVYKVVSTCILNECDLSDLNIHTHVMLNIHCHCLDTDAREALSQILQLLTINWISTCTPHNVIFSLNLKNKRGCSSILDLGLLLHTYH